MSVWRNLSRTVSLREAAAIIFALTAVLPLLVFVSLLSRFELVSRVEAQLGLLLALFLTILGFVVFRRMVDRIARVTQVVGGPVPATVPGLGPVAEIRKIRRTFEYLLRDLRASTEQLRDLMFKLVILNEVIELATRVPKREDLLDLVLERAMQTVGAGIGSIMLLDAERRKLRIAAARGLPDDVVGGVEVNVGEGIAGKIAELGEPVLVEDIETDPRFAKPNDPKYGSGSFISVPIRVGDRVMGLLNLAKKEGGTPGSAASPCFTPIDLRFLSVLMTYVGYALDNTRLLEETMEWRNASGR